MTRLVTLLALALLVVLLPSCAVTEPVPPEPLPRPFTLQYRIWLPMVERAATKKGIGLTYGHCDDALAVGVSWFYTWGPRPKPCPGAESVPMIWGRETIGTQASGTSNYLLGFNEPDRWNQADLKPSEAAELWRDVELLYAGDWLLVSPAVSHTAVDWLEQFYDCYLHRFGRKPVLDALAVHCYANSAAECVATAEEVIALADEWGVSGGVWVTEFAFWPDAQTTLDEALDEARTFIAWMDAELRVARYAWFAARMKGDEWWMGPLTPLVQFDGADLTMYGMMYKGE